MVADEAMTKNEYQMTAPSHNNFLIIPQITEPKKDSWRKKKRRGNKLKTAENNQKIKI